MSSLPNPLRACYERLNFHLEYRIKFEGAQIRENHKLQPEIRPWLEDVCAFYLQADEPNRAAIRALFDTDDKLWHLFMLFDELCTSIRQPENQTIAEMAAILLSIEDARFDPRDWELLLNKLVRVSTFAKVDLSAIFAKAAALSNPLESNGISTRERFVNAVAVLTARNR